MERLDLFKKSLINNGITLVHHKKLEPLHLKDPKNINDINYYYQIIHEGNSSEIIEECLKRRGHWKIFNNELHNSNNISSNNGSFTENNIYNYNDNCNYPHFLWSHCGSRINFNEFNRGRTSEIKK